ncbi:glucans biosynthesis glucosyltransferase MdoH [Pseudaestuariivita sp.]|uniref:glucans biosynthesis glucosyltransferase MdoH n=1 Tax=Pseudaestuariivita sp. TaxID=2211669 RepID=UPI0040589801
MDGLSPYPLLAEMPPEAPLACPAQRLGTCERDRAAPGIEASWHPWAWRAAVVLPALALTVLFDIGFASWRGSWGAPWLEALVMVLVTVTFFWVALSAVTAALGLFGQRRRAPVSKGAQSLRVALLMPVYHEDPAEVFGNAAAMLRTLNEAGHSHAFEFFILSDTQDAALAETERAGFAALRAVLPKGPPVWYRRRTRNTERKSGNIADWVARWGGAFDAMVVLDADSLMTADALAALADEMAADPGVGLIQSAPMLVGQQTLFGRVQQFAGRVYGPLLTHGLARWSDAEGNYWGHNAILRTRAFAATAGLPRMPGVFGPGGLILSHDFVEAGLMRRAGWAVRFRPEITGSFEEPPATLIDFALRDRRWCHGNLQHLMLLGTRGFHAVSRFHLLNGAVSYLLSVFWFALLMVWALMGTQSGAPTSPMPQVHPALILAFMYAMLLAPKVMGALALALRPHAVPLGGWPQFAGSVLLEVLASILYAPILMVQQVVSVTRSALGLSPGWAPQARKGGRYDLVTTVKFHALETVTGVALGAGMLAGMVSLWLLPIALSLACAVPLSLLSGLDLSRWRATRRWMATPEMLNAPRVLRRARAARSQFRRLLESAYPAE